MRYNSNSNTAEALKPVLVVAVVFAVVILTHFSQAHRLGLYEDDFGRIPQAWRMSGWELLDFCRALFRLEAGQGRPFHDGVIYLAGWISGQGPAPLMTGYAMAGVLLCLNGYGFYLMLLKLRIAPEHALVGAVVFVVHPVDGTHGLLTHAYGIQLGQSFVLLALHAFLADRRVAGWVFAGTCLLTYEPYYPLLLGVPLMIACRDGIGFWQQRKALVYHALAGSALLGAVYWMRHWAGEARVVEATGMEMVRAMTEHAVVGPVIGGIGYVYKPGRALGLLQELSVEWWWLAALCCVAAVGMVRRFCNGQGSVRGSASQWMLAFWLVVSAYPLCITVEADMSSLFGRSSRLHSPSAMGFSLLVVLMMVWICSLGRKGRLVGQAGLGIWLSGSMVAGLVAQSDFVAAWQIQRQVWTDVVESKVALGANTDLTIEMASVRARAEAMTMPWTASLILNEFVDETALRGGGVSKPRFYRMRDGEAMELKLGVEPVLAKYLGERVGDRETIRMECSASRGGMRASRQGTERLRVRGERMLTRYLLKQPEEERTDYCTLP